MREVGVRCPCLFLRLCLAFLVFLIALLSVAFVVWGGGGRRRGNSGGRVRVITIGHRVGVGVETKARGGWKELLRRVRLLGRVNRLHSICSKICGLIWWEEVG